MRGCVVWWLLASYSRRWEMLNMDDQVVYPEQGVQEELFTVEQLQEQVKQLEMLLADEVQASSFYEGEADDWKNKFEETVKENYYLDRDYGTQIEELECAISNYLKGGAFLNSVENTPPRKNFLGYVGIGVLYEGCGDDYVKVTVRTLLEDNLIKLSETFVKLPSSVPDGLGDDDIPDYISQRVAREVLRDDNHGVNVRGIKMMDRFDRSAGLSHRDGSGFLPRVSFGYKVSLVGECSTFRFDRAMDGMYSVKGMQG